jgi:hypothetical protein
MTQKVGGEKGRESERGEKIEREKERVNEGKKQEGEKDSHRDERER